MTDDYLISKGWKLVGKQRTGNVGIAHLWSHPEHQKDDGRFYTKHEAQSKQMFIDKPWKHPDPDAVQ